MSLIVSRERERGYLCDVLSSVLLENRLAAGMYLGVLSNVVGLPPERDQNRIKEHIKQKQSQTLTFPSKVTSKVSGFSRLLLVDDEEGGFGLGSGSLLALLALSSVIREGCFVAFPPMHTSSVYDDHQTHHHQTAQLTPSSDNG